MAARIFQVLLVEDDLIDVELTEEALQGCSHPIALQVVNDGLEAMAYLRRQGVHQAAPAPDLIFLDLNMPRMDGREVLTAIRADPALRHLPVIVLTTSKGAEDVLQAYRLGANCFVTKPVGMREFENLIQTVEAFWFETVLLPEAK